MQGAAEKLRAPLLEVRSVDKAFGAAEALKGVSLSVHAAHVHTLLGENGAGKSTLVKILAGIYAPQRGSILLDGVEVALTSPEDARSKGIAVVYQELSLAGNLSVAENIYAGHLPHRFGIVNRRQLMDQARSLLDELHILISAEAFVYSLSVAQRQLVEIAKALSHPSQIVIMDEPTSSLTRSEVDILFGVIERLKALGRAVIYISHRMDEIMRISDEISVMRDGRLIRTLAKQDTAIEELIRLMVGREIRDIYPGRLALPAREGKPLLEVRGLRSPGRFHSVDFSVYRGEVVGLFGLIGAGRSALMNALFGVGPSTGDILIKGRKVHIDSPADAIAHGMAYVTENRQQEGLVLGHSVARNVNMVSFQHGATRSGLVDTNAEEQMVQAAVERMNIKVTTPEQPARELSGGNQQKVVFAKWMSMKPGIMILDEPTRGVDVGARYEIYSAIRELAASGTAIILVSSDLSEVISMSDRLLVMRAGDIVKELDSAGLAQEAVMSYATGTAPS